MKSSKVNDCFVATNKEELLVALKEKKSSILIPEYFKQEFLENTELPMTEEQEIWSELGFQGKANLTAATIFHLINWLSKDSKQQKQIDSKIRKYMLKKYSKDLLLYLRHLDD